MSGQSGGRTSSLSFIFITLLIDVLGIGLLFPILPEYIAHLTSLSLSESAYHYGWLLALYGGMQFLFSPLLGRLSDRYGRRPVLLISLLFGTFDYVLMAMAPHIAWLYIGRLLSGITGANFTAANAYIADVSPPEKRSQNFGLVGAAFGAGFILGPALGGLLSHFGLRTPLWAAAALCFINFLYGWLILPESLPPAQRRAFHPRELNPLASLSILGRHRTLWILSAAIILNTLGLHFINSTWVLFFSERFNWHARETGISFAAFGVIALVYQLGVARIIFPRWGDRRTMRIGLLAMAIECAAYALVPQGWMIYPVMLIGGFGMLGGQAMQGVLSRQVGSDEQGALQGAVASLNSLTGVVAPPAATALFAVFSRDKAGLYLPGMPFYLSGVFSLLAFAVAIRAPIPRDRPTPPGTEEILTA